METVQRLELEPGLTVLTYTQGVAWLWAADGVDPAPGRVWLAGRGYSVLDQGYDVWTDDGVYVPEVEPDVAGVVGGGITAWVNDDELPGDEDEQDALLVESERALELAVLG